MLGLARVVGDGHPIAYLQDILVDPNNQRLSTGRELFRWDFASFEPVRQKVLITDDYPAQHAFYQSMGFTTADDFNPRPQNSSSRSSEPHPATAESGHYSDQAS